MKFNKYFFDQDYSFRWIISWWLVWAWIWFLTSILLDSSIVLIYKIFLSIIWFLILWIWLFLVKYKKTPKIDERLLLVQTKSYAYSWTFWVLWLFLWWILEKEWYFKIDVYWFSTLIIILMVFIYFLTYFIYKNKA